MMNDARDQEKEEEKNMQKVPLEFQMKYMSNRNLNKGLAPVDEDDSGKSHSLGSSHVPGMMSPDLHKINKQIKQQSTVKLQLNASIRVSYLEDQLKQQKDFHER